MSRFTLIAAFLSLASIVSAAPSPATTAAPAPLAVVKANQVIHPSFSDSKCLTAASNADGAAVEIFDCSVKSKSSQLWSITSSGQYMIYGNKCLDNTGGKQTNGNKLQIYTCFSGNTNQEWTRTGQAIQLKNTNFCMDLTDGVRDNGNVEQIYTCTGGGNQKWNIVDGSTGTTTTPPTGPTPTAHLIHPVKGPDSCLAAVKNSDNAQVVIEDCDGSDSQSWTINGDGTLKVFGNKCLDVPNGSTTIGQKLQIYTCFAGNTNQQFKLTAGETFPNNVVSNRIVWSKHTNECLDLTDSNLTNGAQMQLWTCSSTTNNQYWQISVKGEKL